MNLSPCTKPRIFLKPCIKLDLFKYIEKLIFIFCIKKMFLVLHLYLIIDNISVCPGPDYHIWET